MIPKASRNKANVSSDRIDKNQYPTGGTDGSRKPRGVRSINPKGVNTTAPKDL